MDKGSPGALKVFNQREICRCILENGPMTRAQIAKELSLSKPTTSLNVQGLLDSHYLIETTQAVSSVGKKGTLLDFNRDYFFILIVDTTSMALQNKIVLHVCNLKNETILEDTITTDHKYTSQNQKEFFEIYNQRLNEWISHFNHPTGKISHVVLSLPGALNINEKEKLFFNDDTDLSCSISNDINLALLGEKLIQNDSNKNIAYLRINQGLGAAFSLHNQIYTGKDYSAGEIGYYETIITKDDKVESVALKDLISIYAILKEKEELGYVFNKNLSPLDDLLFGINENNPWCIKKISLVYTYLENLIMNLVVTLDLDEIIIAGVILKLIPNLTNKLQDKINSYPLASTFIKEANDQSTTNIGGYYLAMKTILDHMTL
ncbi:MAG: ROK family transcriptional regulator [Coprobacillus sp.]